MRDKNWKMRDKKLENAKLKMRHNKLEKCEINKFKGFL